MIVNICHEGLSFSRMELSRYVYDTSSFRFFWLPFFLLYQLPNKTQLILKKLWTSAMLINKEFPIVCYTWKIILFVFSLHIYFSLTVSSLDFFLSLSCVYVFEYQTWCCTYEWCLFLFFFPFFFRVRACEIGLHI